MIVYSANADAQLVRDASLAGLRVGLEELEDAVAVFVGQQAGCLFFMFND